MRKIWFPFYLDDYDSDTSHLSFEEHGAYMALLRQYYRGGKPLDANASILHRVCRAFTASEKAAIDVALHQFFRENGGKYHHKRADQELAKINELSEKRSKAARIKWDANASAHGKHLHTESESQSHTHADKVKSFVQPTQRDATVYFRDLGALSDDEAQEFLDYYSSNGWKVGRASMKDWKAAARRWHRNDKHNGARWRKADGAIPSKHEQRIAKNRENILTGLGLSQVVRPGGPTVQDGDSTGRGENLVKQLRGRTAGDD